MVRGIYPIVSVIRKEGISDIPDEKIKQVVESFLENQREN
jgi:hypothetical protein